MKQYAPDMLDAFHCLAASCPDNCCRQGWQIVVDPEHTAFYRTLSGPLGQKVRAALVTEPEQTLFSARDGICPLLSEDGLCPLVTAYGQDGLCTICRTHPRFLEDYGGTREIHFSLSCPEAARLLLLRETPIAYRITKNAEPVTTMNTIDPEEYLFLLRLRSFSLALLQHRAIPIMDRLALLLQLGAQAQRLMDRGKYKLCKPLCQNYLRPDYRRARLARVKRIRLQGTSFFPEIELLRSMEELTGTLSPLLHEAVFTARSASAWDRELAIPLENLCVQYLAHYIPKAVNDGRADTKLYAAVLLTLTARRFCICTGKTAPEALAAYAGLLAKELEHCEENMTALFRALEKPYWRRHLTMQLELSHR